MAEFPVDILLDVLSRLPVKYVLRFRCVCKSWCSLISEPQFVKTQLNRAISDVNIGCQRVLIPGYKTLESIDYEALQLLSKKELREALRNNDGNARRVLDFPWNHLRFVGSCHGMVCMVVGRDKIVLYNPCTREFKELPKPTSISISFKYLHIHGGLGYDSYADDYKFVIAGHEDGEKFKAEVFSLRSNSWRILRDIPPDIYDFAGFGGGVFSNGALYWIAGCHFLQSNCQKIVSFDLATEKFHELLSLPTQGNHQIYPTGYSNIFLQGGRLSVSSHDNKTEIWAMKEYSGGACWTKLCSLDIRTDVVPMHRRMTALCFTNNGELLVDVEGKIISYNPKNRNSRRLYEGNWCLAGIVLCIGSLVSPNGNVKNTPHHITQQQKKKDNEE